MWVDIMMKWNGNDGVGLDGVGVGGGGENVSEELWAMPARSMYYPADSG